MQQISSNPALINSQKQQVEKTTQAILDQNPDRNSFGGIIHQSDVEVIQHVNSMLRINGCSVKLPEKAYEMSTSVCLPIAMNFQIPSDSSVSGIVIVIDLCQQDEIKIFYTRTSNSQQYYAFTVQMDPSGLSNFYTSYRITNAIIKITGSTVTGGANPLTGYLYGGVFSGLPHNFSYSSLQALGTKALYGSYLYSCMANKTTTIIIPNFAPQIYKPIVQTKGSRYISYDYFTAQFSTTVTTLGPVLVNYDFSDNSSAFYLVESDQLGQLVGQFEFTLTTSCTLSTMWIGSLIFTFNTKTWSNGSFSETLVRNFDVGDIPTTVVSFEQYFPSPMTGLAISAIMGGTLNQTLNGTLQVKRILNGMSPNMGPTFIIPISQLSTQQTISINGEFNNQYYINDYIKGTIGAMTLQGMSMTDYDTALRIFMQMVQNGQMPYITEEEYKWLQKNSVPLLSASTIRAIGKGTRLEQFVPSFSQLMAPYGVYGRTALQSSTMSSQSPNMLRLTPGQLTKISKSATKDIDISKFNVKDRLDTIYTYTSDETSNSEKEETDLELAEVVLKPKPKNIFQRKHKDRGSDQYEEERIRRQRLMSKIKNEKQQLHELRLRHQRQLQIQKLDLEHACPPPDYGATEEAQSCPSSYECCSEGSTVLRKLNLKDKEIIESQKGNNSQSAMNFLRGINESWTSATEEGMIPNIQNSINAWRYCITKKNIFNLTELCHKINLGYLFGIGVLIPTSKIYKLAKELIKKQMPLNKAIVELSKLASPDTSVYKGFLQKIKSLQEFGGRTHQKILSNQLFMSKLAQGELNYIFGNIDQKELNEEQVNLREQLKSVLRGEVYENPQPIQPKVIKLQQKPKEVTEEVRVVSINKRSPQKQKSPQKRMPQMGTSIQKIRLNAKQAKIIPLNPINRKSEEWKQSESEEQRSTLQEEVQTEEQPVEIQDYQPENKELALQATRMPYSRLVTTVQQLRSSNQDHQKQKAFEQEVKTRQAIMQELYDQFLGDEPLDRDPQLLEMINKVYKGKEAIPWPRDYKRYQFCENVLTQIEVCQHDDDFEELQQNTPKSTMKKEKIPLRQQEMIVQMQNLVEQPKPLSFIQPMVQPVVQLTQEIKSDFPPISSLPDVEQPVKKTRKVKTQMIATQLTNEQLGKAFKGSEQVQAGVKNNALQYLKKEMQVANLSSSTSELKNFAPKDLGTEQIAELYGQQTHMYKTSQVSQKIPSLFTSQFYNKLLANLKSPLNETNFCHFPVVSTVSDLNEEGSIISTSYESEICCIYWTNQVYLESQASSQYLTVYELGSHTYISQLAQEGPERFEQPEIQLEYVRQIINSHQLPAGTHVYITVINEGGPSSRIVDYSFRCAVNACILKSDPKFLYSGSMGMLMNSLTANTSMDPIQIAHKIRSIKWPKRFILINEVAELIKIGFKEYQIGFKAINSHISINYYDQFSLHASLNFSEFMYQDLKYQTFQNALKSHSLLRMNPEVAQQISKDPTQKGVYEYRPSRVDGLNLYDFVISKLKSGSNVAQILNGENLQMIKILGKADLVTNHQFSTIVQNLASKWTLGQQIDVSDQLDFQKFMMYDTYQRVNTMIKIPVIFFLKDEEHTLDYGNMKYYCSLIGSIASRLKKSDRLVYLELEKVASIDENQFAELFLHRTIERFSKQVEAAQKMLNMENQCDTEFTKKPEQYSLKVVNAEQLNKSILSDEQKFEAIFKNNKISPFMFDANLEVVDNFSLLAAKYLASKRDANGITLIAGEFTRFPFQMRYLVQLANTSLNPIFTSSVASKKAVPGTDISQGLSAQLYEQYNGNLKNAPIANKQKEILSICRAGAIAQVFTPMTDVKAKLEKSIQASKPQK